MASPNIHGNGVGGTTGAALALLSPLYTSGNIWYVSSVTGSDAATPRGKERIRPLATLLQAYTNAAAGDIIVLLANHAETIAVSQTLGKAGLLVISEGSGANRARLTRGADIVMLDITAAGVRLVNAYFPASTVASTSARVKTAAADTWVTDSYFECGTLDTGPSLETVTGAGAARFATTTFASTSASVASQPESAVKITNAITELTLDTLVFDGGVSGWSNPYALNGAGAVTRLRAENIDLLNDSDATLATGTTGHFHVRNKSGSARVVWTA